MRTFLMVIATLIMGHWAVTVPEMFPWCVVALGIVGGGLLCNYLNPPREN